ncbi:hypothetical protein P154DRAFT_598381 [Amniculicola lignicola CBS 123094]|uniref:Uncharacterized protein n=1 Tax=Amniculicola lignicola CBS 123094 TaxID=1392246 RepID=A0A6A5WH46_9PLEO|nr:hypothetical protein P154DRAFT_598381 [Amniculicola lignicola CBS 123094]
MHGRNQSMSFRTTSLLGLVLVLLLQTTTARAEEELMINVQVEPTNIRGNPATETQVSPASKTQLSPASFPQIAPASLSSRPPASSPPSAKMTTTTTSTTRTRKQPTTGLSMIPPHKSLLPPYPSNRSLTITSAPSTTTSTGNPLEFYDSAASKMITFVMFTPYSPPMTTLVSGAASASGLASASVSMRANYSRTLDGWGTWTGETARPTSGGSGLSGRGWGWGWIVGGVVLAGWMLG